MPFLVAFSSFFLFCFCILLHSLYFYCFSNNAFLLSNLTSYGAAFRSCYFPILSSISCKSWFSIYVRYSSWSLKFYRNLAFTLLTSFESNPKYSMMKLPLYLLFSLWFLYSFASKHSNSCLYYFYLLKYDKVIWIGL